MRRHGRRDTTHTEIRDGLRDVGWYVYDTADLPGFVDLVVIGPGGTIVLVEVKGPGGQLEESQEKILTECGLTGAPFVVAHTLQEAVDGVSRAVSRRH